VLRTMITDTPFEQKWVLQGRLCGVWALDLQEKWHSTKSTREGRKCAVDLEDVISVDCKGERVLLQMASEGAVLRASRAYMKHILESLKEQQQQSLKETQECESKPKVNPQC
jgi:anti-anti-sigma regulatory factor